MFRHSLTDCGKTQSLARFQSRAWFWVAQRFSVCVRTRFWTVWWKQAQENAAPEGRPRLAQRFSAGKSGRNDSSPGGTTESSRTLFSFAMTRLFSRAALAAEGNGGTHREFSPERQTFLSALAKTLAVVIALATGTAFAQGAAKHTPAKPRPQSNITKRNLARPSVILITIDTLRADHVGCYGAQGVKTPTLDGLCDDGVVFERAISQVPLTWPSHAVILTGTYPFQNGVQDFTGQPLAQQFRTVAQAFQQTGYATGAVVSAFVLDRSWGLARGFDFYDDAFSAETFEKKDIGLVDRRAGESVAHAIAWLKKTPRRPFFLWLHLYDPHSPYDPPEAYRSEYRSHLYDGEIAYADHELGNLMAWLKQNHLYDSSLIVALSDHGESLGEHGEDEHGFFVYNATVHVPLIVKPPAGSGIATGRHGEPVETAAVAPTLLELAGLKNSSDRIHAQFQSPALFAASLSKFEASQTLKDPAYSETFY